MAKLTLKEKLAAMPLSEFSFISFEKKVSSPNSEGAKITYLLFELEAPIGKVTGSSDIPNPDGNDTINATLVDVMEVRCNAELMFVDEERPEKEREFQFEEDAKGKLTGKGKYAGDLFLDISRKDEVWLTDVKFKDFGKKMFKDGVRERFQRYKK